MAVRATFTADLSSFQSAVAKAEVQLKSFGTVSGSLEKQLNQMGNSFTGRKIIQEAHLMEKAIEAVGGVSKLTAAEQSRANVIFTEANAKIRALGIDGEHSFAGLEKATRSAGESTSFLGKQAVAVGAFFGTALGNLAFSAVQKVGGALVQAASDGAKFTAISGSFDRLTDSIGESGDAMLSITRGATKGLVSDLELMQSANKAMLLGLPVTTKEMGTLSKAAVTLGRAMGQDATKSLDDMITALGRSSPLILDNLGLTVKVGEANEKYAATLGKTSSELTDAEKKLAFYKAAMEAAEKKTAELGEVQLGVIDQLSRLGTSVGNIVTQMAAGANESGVFSRALGGLAKAAETAALDMQDLAAAQKAVAETRATSGFLEGVPISDTSLEEQLEKIRELRSRSIAASGAVLQLADGLGKLGPTAEEVRKLDEQTKKLKETLAKNAEWAQRNGAALVKMGSDARNAAQMMNFNDARLMLGEVEDAIRIAGVSVDEFDLSARKGAEGAAQLAGEARLIAAEILAKTGPSLQRMTVDIERAGAAAEKSTGLFARFTQGLGDLWKGMSGGNGFKGLFENLGDSLITGFGNLLSGGITSMVNMAIEGLGKLAGKLWHSLTGGPSEAEVQGRKTAADFTRGLEEELTSGQLATVAGLVAEGASRNWAIQAVAIQDAFIAAGKTAEEALVWVDRLWQAEKQGPEAVAAVMADLEPILDKHREQLEANAEAAKKAAGELSGMTEPFDILQEKIENLESINEIEEAFEDFRKSGTLDLRTVLREVERLQTSLGDNAALMDLSEAIKQAVETGIVDFNRLRGCWGDLEAMMRQGVTIPLSFESSGGGGDDGGGGDNEGGDRGGYLTPEEAREAGVQWRPKDDFDWSDSAYRDRRDQDASEINKQAEENSFAGGTGGRYLNFGSGTYATLHGSERVMTAAEGAAESASYAELCAIRRLLQDLPRALVMPYKTALIEAGYRY